MKKPSKVLVNNTQEFLIGEDRIQSLDILKESDSAYHLLHDQKSILARVVDSDFNNKTYTININSNNYKVQIQTPLDDLIKKMGYTIGSARVVNSITAPMPGIIIGIQVKKDQEVKEGDTLLILEAMKMENAIICPKDAKIKEVYVAIGDTVDKNKLLITLE
jgi:biotin carboxyl carrier protein